MKKNKYQDNSVDISNAVIIQPSDVEPTLVFSTEVFPKFADVPFPDLNGSHFALTRGRNSYEHALVVVVKGDVYRVLLDRYNFATESMSLFHPNLTRYETLHEEEID